MMKIEVRYFAGVREALGLPHESLTLPEGIGTVGAVREFLMRRGDAWAAALDGRRALRMAYNQQMAGPDTPIAEAGELAFFPPVTGG